MTEEHFKLVYHFGFVMIVVRSLEFGNICVRLADDSNDEVHKDNS